MIFANFVILISTDKSEKCNKDATRHILETYLRTVLSGLLVMFIGMVNDPS